MAEKFVKIDKEFTLSDSTLNVYGFRLLTSGYQLAEFNKNPIGFYLHADAEHSEYTRKDGVLVKWENLSIKGDKIVGKPCINMHHPRGQQTVDEINNGFLNAASMGKLVALEISTDPSLMLPDQIGPTVTKWYNRESSLVDIPGNYNALADLCDAEGKPINLADFKTQIKNMNELKLTAAQLALINLADNATGEAVTTTLKALVEKANLVDGLTTERDTALQSLADFKKQSTAKAVTEMLAQGLADRKITVQLQGTLAKQYEGKPDELKELIDALPAQTSLTEKLKTDGSTALQNLMAKDWDTIDKEGKLPDLKAGDFEAFKAKYKERFNKEYKGQ